MKIAIVGTGISGLGAAYLLNPQHDITVYEAAPGVGGHSRTIDVPTPQGRLPVDTGFIVFNHANYPLLTGLFDHLGVETEASDMSFGVSIANGWLEYSSDAPLAQMRNLFRPAYWGMIRDVLRFNREAASFIEAHPDLTLDECLTRMRMGQWFRDYYLEAMGAAIWSCSADTILKYPAAAFIRFFKNHCLLSITKHLQWYTVRGGSRAYVAKLTAGFADKIRTSCAVTRITRDNDGVTVMDARGESARYDHVIMAAHANQSLALLDRPTADEQDILGAFTYQPNNIIVHSDPSFMPQRRKCWASWIYLSQHQQDNNESVSLTYWMNRLQNLPTATPVLVTLNPHRRPAEHLIHDEHRFSHPVFTAAALKAQQELPRIQGKNHVSYCGAWQRYGFHEDGLLSAVQVAQQLGAPLPWK